MNEFFTAMTDVVLAHRGMLDKYIDDSLMAVFGAPLPDQRHAARACRASIDMRATLASLHARWRAEGRPEAWCRLASILPTIRRGGSIRRIRKHAELDRLTETHGVEQLVGPNTAAHAEMVG
jgi:class 3 adenylate cyclase